MPKSRTDRALTGLFIVLLAAFVWTLRGQFEQRIVGVGDDAPQFSVTTESGRRVSTSEFGGRLLVVNFWATWCAPCIEEMPSLNEFARQMSKDGVIVLGVSVDKNERAYKQFLERARLAFDTARDPEAAIPAEYGTFKWPGTYVIDRGGRVVQKHIGAKDWLDPEIVRSVRAFL